MASLELEKYLPTAQTALHSFLHTLLNQDVSFQVSEPEPTAFAREQAATAGKLCLHATLAPAKAFAVVLEPSWLPLLSKVMLGEALQMGAPGYDDLIRELAGQAWGTLRVQLGGMQVTLPDVLFEVVEAGQPLPEGLLGDDLLGLNLALRIGSETHAGRILLPPLHQPAPPPSAPTTPFAAAPSAAAPGSFGTSSSAPTQPLPTGQVNVAPVSFPELGGETIGGDGAFHSIGLLAEVELEVAVELGRRRMPLSDILRLTPGSVIELEKLLGEPLQVYANGRLIAEGEAVVIDEQFGVRITSLITTRQREKLYR